MKQDQTPPPVETEVTPSDESPLVRPTRVDPEDSNATQDWGHLMLASNPAYVMDVGKNPHSCQA